MSQTRDLVFEQSATETAHGPEWWLPLGPPASLPNPFQALFESFFFFGGGLSNDTPWRVHTTLMHCEEVFTIEIIVARISGVRITILGVAHAYVATVESQLDVLNRNMTFPFVLGREGRNTAITRESAGEFGVLRNTNVRARTLSRWWEGVICVIRCSRA